MKLLIAFGVLFGASFAATTLEEDFKDFLALIPETQIRDIAKKYLATDLEFQAAVTYLQGEEFSKLVKDVRKMEAVKEFEKYLMDAGIDIEAVLKYLHDLITDVQPTIEAQPRSLKGFLEEVKKTIPTGKMIKLLMDKMKNSSAFQEFFKKVSSEETHQLVEEVRALPEVKRLTTKLTELGIEVERYVKILYAIFGWK